ncbi:DUF6992 family protein [Hydrotalea sandarakina]|jgi:hypothetical protein|uniref:Uncharacterized protein n=1 Tax=Hydrotalea sandarakina TaxID=1004304 RepID=A0A2W7RTT1_9BACT|nr:hypothetical protein [Hydrotalea sandarakina]PZX63734.1 hypothetical protein LX80_01392 [Hydrotalea sandarakina]
MNSALNFCYKVLLVAIVIFFCQKSYAQINSNTNQELSDSVYRNRQNIIKRNMTVLGAWAGVNIIQSSISAASTTGSTQAFFKMNVYWNVANAAIAGIGILSAKKALKHTVSAQKNWQQQQNIEKLLLLNTGLDAAYITTGLYLKEHGLRVNNPQTQGYGTSIMVQGGFLLIFDLIQYFDHHQNGKKLNQLNFEPTNSGVGLVWHL